MEFNSVLYEMQCCIMIASRTLELPSMSRPALLAHFAIYVIVSILDITWHPQVRLGHVCAILLRITIIYK